MAPGGQKVLVFVLVLVFSGGGCGGCVRGRGLGCGWRRVWSNKLLDRFNWRFELSKQLSLGDCGWCGGISVFGA